MQETVGQRISRLRYEQNLTQEELAERIAISRVAVSHIEMDLNIPSERTVTLLAGVFKQSPYELVKDTTYPLAKAERLPSIAYCYTDFDLALALLNRDLRWLERLAVHPQTRNELTDQWKEIVKGEWLPLLSKLSQTVAGKDRERLQMAKDTVRKACLTTPQY